MTNLLRHARAALLCLAFAVVIGAPPAPAGADDEPPAGGGQPQPEAPAAPKPETPAPATPPATPAGSPSGAPERQVLHLSAREALDFALENNLDVQISRLGPELGHWDIVSAMGIFDPIVFWNYKDSKDVRPTGSALSGAPVLNQLTGQFDTGVKGELFQGLRYTFDYQGQRSFSNSTFAELNPSWTTSLGFGLTQSILRGGGTKAVMSPVRIARKNKAAALDQFEVDLNAATFNVLSAYWNLVFAIKDRDVKDKSLKLAQRLLEVNRNKVRVGSMAPIEELEAEASVAAQQEGILVAENAIENAADSVKRLIFPVRQNLNEWDVSLLPVDEPLFIPRVPDMNNSIVMALGRRAEFARLMKEAEAQDLVIVQAQNAQLPLLDVSWSFRYNGLAKGLEESFDDLRSTDFKTWEIGFIFEYPLGNRSAHGKVRKAEVEKRRLILQMKNLEQQIVVEVREAVREIQTTTKRIDATGVAVQLAVKQLEAEEKRLELGLSTSHQVLQVQKDLAQAEENATKATIDYTMALYKYQKAIGTLLYEQHIELR